jgi:hypothetical protein
MRRVATFTKGATRKNMHAPLRKSAFPAAACISLALGAACSSPSQTGPGGPMASPEGGAIGSGLPATDASTAGQSDASSGGMTGNDVDAQGDDGSAAAGVDSGSLGASSPEGGSTGTLPPPQDAGPDASVERISVSGTGTPASFKTSLTTGATYLLKAVGSVDVGGQKVDAEYVAAPDGTGAMDMAGTTDVGIDVGLLQPNAMNHTTFVSDGPGRIKWYGAFRADHTYWMWVTGKGMPLTLKLVAGAAGGSGAIAVSLYELGPAPPATYTLMNGPKPPAPPPPKIGRDALEVIQVPVTKTVVTGKYMTDKNAVYLVVASGVGQVSNGMITPASPHMGDAEYMDWPLSGAKFNDGECGAEFGIGVDEIQGPAGCTGGIVYTHRKNWWGPYRNDHVYYMLHAGTGMPIQFLYYDSGYGDNSPTDALTVAIFPVP